MVQEVAGSNPVGHPPYLGEQLKYKIKNTSDFEKELDLKVEKLFSILKDEEINPATRPVIKKIEKKEKNFEIDVLITLWPKLSKLPKLEQEVEVESIKPTEEELDEDIDEEEEK